MQLDNKTIKKLLKKYKEDYEALEEYDKTHKLPFKREKIYITLSVSTLAKLKELRTKTGKPISRIIEEKFLI